jgi:DNA-binding NtrC family response regulator
MGLLESAGDGTLFLDEIAEMPAHLQPKLLRVLQTRIYRRVGGKHEKKFKARVVSATNRRLGAQDCDGLRSDLYFRLAGFTIALPPLRERKEDIEKLAVHFLSVFAFRYPGLPTRFALEATEALQAYSWPGNVRELQAVVERAAMNSSSGTIEEGAIVQALRQSSESSLPPPSPGPRKAVYRDDASAPGFPAEGSTLAHTRPGFPPEESTLARTSSGMGAHDLRATAMDLNELQRQITVEQFIQNGKNLARTARALGIPRTTLRDRLKRYGEL